MKRAQQKIQTRKKLFQAAIELFNCNGVEKTKISDIAKKADVSTGTFYVHFKSKEEIISAIYYEDFNNYMCNKIQEVIQLNLDWKKTLLKIGIFELDFAKKVGLEVTTIAFVANLQANMSTPGNHSKKRIFSNEIKKITDSFSNNNLAYQEFESIIRGVMLTWCFSNGKIDVIKLGNSLLEKYINKINDNEQRIVQNPNI
ncbi:TetR/AcrR family transcriptional regulator [Liquorilactobacillus nagelii]|uniref:TetR/AcrR family transcriptional regulator n=4 Tax=Liquorilactobacillus TaxID=2767888 RepID=UPI0039E89EFD